MFAISARGGSHQPLTIFDWLIKISARKIPAAVQIVTPKCSELTERQPRFQSRFKSAISAPVYPAYIVRFSSRQFIEFSIEPPDKSSRQPLGPTAHRRPRRADHAHGTGRDGPGHALAQPPTPHMAITGPSQPIPARPPTYLGHIAHPAPTATLQNPANTEQSTATFPAATAHLQQPKKRPGKARK